MFCHSSSFLFLLVNTNLVSCDNKNEANFYMELLYLHYCKGMLFWDFRMCSVLSRIWTVIQMDFKTSVSKTGTDEHGTHQNSGEDITEKLPKYR